jgi:Coenzyme PQQ synthesis protein D (PqqD)
LQSEWELLKEVGHAEEILKRLLEEYDAGEDQLRQDLADFVANLKLRGLAEVH